MQIPSFFIKSYYRLFSRDITRFLAVGSVGFIVNYVMLILLFDLLGLPILASQIVGAEIALIATFTGNNLWAFQGHRHIPIKKKLMTFHATAGIGILINSSCVITLVRFEHVYYGLALVVGSCAGLIWNYTLNKKVVFKAGTPPTK
jgi:putative flippase GtrA